MDALKPNQIFQILDFYGFVTSGTCEMNGMRSIHDESSCRSAGTWSGKNMKNFQVMSSSYGNSKPTGCSWHNSGNVELWKSSSGDCGAGYHGCFCMKTQGKNFLF